MWRYIRPPVRRVISIMITRTRATAMVETTAAIGKASADPDGSGVDVTVETGLMVSVKPSIEKKKYRLCN